MNSGRRFKYRVCVKVPLLLVVCLTACSSPHHLPAVPGITPSALPSLVVTPPARESSLPSTVTPVQTLNPTPTPTVTSSFFPMPDLIAAVPCTLNPTEQADTVIPGIECSIAVLRRLSGKFELTYHVSEEGVNYKAPLFSPCGRWMVYTEQVGGQARLRLVSTDWQTDRPLTDWYEVSVRDLTSQLQALSWSQDSVWLAFTHFAPSSFDRVYIINVNTDELKLIGENISAFVWSPRIPAQLAFSSGGENVPLDGIYLATISSLSHAERIESIHFPEGSTPVSLAWHPDGTSLAVSMRSLESDSSFNRFGLLDLATRRVEWQRMDQPSGFCDEIVWSSSGRWLSCFDYSGVFVYETEQWQVVRRLRGQEPTHGSWMNDEFLFLTVHGRSPTYLNLGLSSTDSWDLVVIMMERGEIETLWSTSELNLEFDFFDRPSWYLEP